jgi:circadian clock protein KaiC
MSVTASAGAEAATGVPGLDAILGGGLPRDHVYLVQGDPGAGKTTLALQFLLEGAAKGETGLYITLSESRRELMAVARSHGWELDGIVIHEQLIGEEMVSEEDVTLFHPSEIELGEAVNTMLKAIEEAKPMRVAIDSLAEIRMLSQSTVRFRKQVLALKEYFARKSITAVLLDDRTSEFNDIQLHSVPYGVIVLERLSPMYGAARRRMEVVKLRGVNFRGGYHDFSIRTGGMMVFPRPIALAHRSDSVRDQLACGVPEIDQITGGGLSTGNSTVIMGPAGAGKSTLATRYAVAAAEQGRKAAMFIFDESQGTLFTRSHDLGMPLDEHVKAGLITVQQIDPAELSPGEFTYMVRSAVDDGACVVVIDSLNGFLNSMPEERYLTLHLHELLSHLGERGVVSIVVMAQHGLLGPSMTSAVDVSYLADCVILLRYYEANAEIHKAISVLKKRSGRHERSIRNFELGDGGITVGPPLRRFRGLMTGIPVITDQSDVDGSLASG